MAKKTIFFLFLTGVLNPKPCNFMAQHKSQGDAARNKIIMDLKGVLK